MKRFLKKASKLLGVALSVLLALVFVVCVYVCFCRFILGKQDVSVFGYSAYYVVTGSMEPEIGAGDWVCARKESVYHTGDIIVFVQGNSRITHRIVGKTDNGFITQGDANNVSDGEISKSAVIGKVVASSALIGKITGFFSTTGGILTLILIGALLFELCLHGYIKGGGRDDDKGEKE